MSSMWRAVTRIMLGEPLTPNPDGLKASIEASWFLTPGLALLLVLVCLGVVAAIYWHERSTATRRFRGLLACLRMAVILLIVLMLYGWTMQHHRMDRPDVVIVLDDSASMGIVDSAGDKASIAEVERRVAKLGLDQATRLSLAKALLLDRDGELLRGLQQGYHVRVYCAGASARSLPAEDSDLVERLKAVSASETASRLGSCLSDVLEAQRGRPTAGVIMFTDGITTDGKSMADAAQLARRKSIPLFLVGLGSDRAKRDLSLADLVADDVVFAGDVVHFAFKLLARGYSGSAVVRLTREGETQTLAEETVNLDGSGTEQPVRLSHRAEQAGEFNYVIEVAAHEGEATLDNNRLVRRVMVRDEIVRVLLVQAYPSYEFRFLKQMLLRELNSHQSEEGRTAGFRTVLQEADLAYTESDKTAERTFPVSREELFQYDVLIFGDVNPSLLSPTIMSHIDEFVTVRGGGVIFIAGPRYMPLGYRDTPIEHLLPMNLNTVSVPDAESAVSDSFRPRLTPLGQASPMMQLADTPAASQRVWSEQLAPLRWMISMPDLRPGVRVLAENPTRDTDHGTPLPVITLQFVGAGKILFHATDETHRWRFRAGDQYFARYWVQTIRYLCRSKLLAGSREIELSTDREEYRRSDEVNLRVRFLDDRMAPAADDGVMVVVESERGQRRQVGLHRHALARGLFEGSAGTLAAGRYRAWVVAPAASGSPTAAEFTVVTPVDELAQTQMDAPALREAAKISLGKYYTFATAEGLLSDLPVGPVVRVESLPPKPIWNAPIFAGLFVALIATEWLLRKRAGLL